MKYCRNGRPLIPSIADTCDYIDGSALRRLIANASNRVKAFMAHSVRKQRARDLYMDGDFEEIWKLFSTNFFLNRNILFSFFPFTKHDYSLVRNSFPLCYFFFFSLRTSSRNSTFVFPVLFSLLCVRNGRFSRIWAGFWRNTELAKLASPCELVLVKLTFRGSARLSSILRGPIFQKSVPTFAGLVYTSFRAALIA